MVRRAVAGVTFTAGRRLTFPGPALGAPVQAAATTSGTGGTLPATTAYYYVVTALTGTAETNRSNEQTVTTSAGTTNSNVISWAAVVNATSYRVYRGTTASGENVYFAPGNVLTFTDTGGAGTGGTPPATDGTAGASTTYLAGSTIPNSVVKVIRRLDTLLSRRWIIPSQEVYARKNMAARAKKPKPTRYISKERAGL